MFAALPVNLQLHPFVLLRQHASHEMACETSDARIPGSQRQLRIALCVNFLTLLRAQRGGRIPERLASIQVMKRYGHRRNGFVCKDVLVKEASLSFVPV